MDDLRVNPDPEEVPLPRCNNCSQVAYKGSRFCNHCGHALAADIAEPTDEEKWNAIRQAALFFLIYTVGCCIVNFVSYFKTFAWSIIFDCILAAVAIVFFAINWSKLRSLLTWESFSLWQLLGLCGIAIIASLVVNLAVSWLNISLYKKNFSYYAFYADHKHGEALAIFFVAVMPALFEELGYRGFLLGKLMLVTDKKQAIFISSFVFAIMHRSFISLFWLIPFALWLGYVRTKENTLWYGVCIHFCFNLTAVLLEIIQSGSPY